LSDKGLQADAAIPNPFPGGELSDNKPVGVDFFIKNECMVEKDS